MRLRLLTPIDCFPSDIRINTVHVDDVSRALWAVAKWIEPIGREGANAIAGEKMYFANDKAKVRDVEGVPSPDEIPVAPLFNVVRVLSFFF